MSNNTTNTSLKILITGGDGMLGKMLGTVLYDYKPIVLNRTALDITNWDQAVAAITKYSPNIIINAAAYTAVDACETNIDQAYKINSIGPGYLASIARSINAKLIQYSTDYIFDGQNSTGYTEDNLDINPINVYGESKARAEENIQKNCEQYYIIRTAWLYGPNGKNFVDTILKLAQTKTSIEVVNDQHGSPTYTKDLAMQTKYIIENNLPFGIYHVTNSGTCTWFDFARAIIKTADLTTKVLPCSTSAFPRPAKRPAYSILINTKLPQLRHWSEVLDDYLNNSYFKNLSLIGEI